MLYALLCLAAPLLGSCSPSAEAPPLPKMRNLVLITLDTTRADFLTCLGGDPRITPNLDALAARSCLFTSAMSETNVTNPSHLTILSGLPAIRHGILNNESKMPEDLDTLAAAFQRAGFKTAGFAAIPHVGPKLGWKGFDTLPAPPPQGRASQITARAASWLEQNRDGPFFMWVHYFDPHMLYTPPPDIRSKFYPGDPTAGDGPPIQSHRYFRKHKGVGSWLGDARDPDYPRALYAGEIHFMDREIGKLMAAIERAGLSDDTMIVAVADHGESMEEHEIFYNHLGLYEQQLRIPLIIHVPGLAPRRIGVPVSTLDIAPTVAEALNIELGHPVPGLSLVTLLAGGSDVKAERRKTFVHQHVNNSAVAVRDGDWKLIWPIKSTYHEVSDAPQLFNLRDDPGELTNLAPTQEARVDRMRKTIEPWIRLKQMKKTQTMDEEVLQKLRQLGYDGM